MQYTVWEVGKRHDLDRYTGTDVTVLTHAYNKVVAKGRQAYIEVDNRIERYTLRQIQTKLG